MSSSGNFSKKWYPQAPYSRRCCQSREEPLYVHSPQAPAIVLPSSGVKGGAYLQSLTTLVTGGNGLSRPCVNLGFRD